MEGDFLEETKYCDISSKEICEFTETLKSREVIDTIENIFNFVRDEVKYRFDYPCVKASETLKKKIGTCFNKTNLQIALLRKAGIPAGYGVYLVHREILKSILPQDIFTLVNEPTIHVFAKVFIHNRWIGLDATVDKELFETFYKNSDIWNHEKWDRKGEILLDKFFIVEDQGLYANIDLYLSQPPRFWTDELIKKANFYIEEKIKEKRVENVKNN
ncbi:MAG: transglutaminase family protein [Candidatus Omnitrophica bacterium]|nr:transglutaminase family protein [Candidatus Omnitrophota bacterium]